MVIPVFIHLNFFISLILGLSFSWYSLEVIKKSLNKNAAEVNSLYLVC